MGAPQRRAISETGHRVRMAGVTVCWILIAIAYTGFSSEDLWYPDMVGVMSVLCALTTLVLTIRPKTGIAYRWGGALGIGTFLLRMVSVLEVVIFRDDHELLWFLLAEIGLTNLLCYVYGRWWLTEVMDWHRYHVLADD